jgi:cell division protein FtsA
MGEGYTTINREENKVNGEDILRALQSSVYNKITANRELISIMPLEFKLDDKLVVNDPKGKTCSKLGVKSLISLVPKKSTFGILSVLESLGITAVDLCFNTMADYYEFKNNDNKDKMGAVINIGSEKTEIGIINKGILIAVDTLFYGGKNIDRDISYIYNINRSDAKRLKERFALAHKENASTSETEEVVTKDNETIKVNQYEISEIVYSRLKEILDFAKKQINILTKREISYIIITGGTTEINDFQKILDESFNKNVVLQSVNEIGVRSNKYSSVLGFIKYYHSKLNFRSKVATTLTEEEQGGLFVKKAKINNGNILGKIYGYFFDN